MRKQCLDFLQSSFSRLFTIVKIRLSNQVYIIYENKDLKTDFYVPHCFTLAFPVADLENFGGERW